MLACGHQRESFGVPICTHLRVCREPWLSYVRWYTGNGMDMELLCKSCVAERQNGNFVATEPVCQECFEYATREIGDLYGARGKPEIRIRSEPFDVQIQKTDLPVEVGRIVDISSVTAESRSAWLLLSENGGIYRFDAGSGHWRQLARADVVLEPDHEPWCGHVLKRRLYSAPNGDFAAVVND